MATIFGIPVCDLAYWQFLNGGRPLFDTSRATDLLQQCPPPNLIVPPTPSGQSAQATLSGSMVLGGPRRTALLSASGPSVSKGDFKAGCECPTKLHYRKNRYPDAKWKDDFVNFLADGGFMVGKMAQLLFPDGIEITGRNREEAIAETQKYLAEENVVLFEPAITVDGMLIRADILIKKGKVIELIEVKAKSIDGNDLENHESGGTACFWKKRGQGLSSEWQPYLEDVAYQTLVLRRAFPDAEIRPFLMLCDKSRETGIDNLLQQFLLRRFESERGTRHEVEFTGDAEAVRRDNLLTRIDVLPEVEHLLPEVEAEAERFVASVAAGARIQGALGVHCRDCEFRLPPDQTDQTERNGFLECWGALGTVVPHLLELRWLGSLKKKGVRLADTLIAEGKASLYDIPEEWLHSPSQGAWQKRQIEHTRSGQEWIGPGLQEELGKHKYPLHFIDFETSRMALPYHKGMRPYGLVAFQWSCHTIRAPGAEPEHSEWINTTDTYPNVEFARTLMERLGRDGTTFMWSHHERSTLRDIAAHIRASGQGDPELIDWLEWVDGELVDQCKIATDHYYHPDMKGSVSIKFVLPAVWNNHPSLHEVPYFRPFYRESGGKVINPYETLERIEIADRAEVIHEGTGAMRAYQEMMYGLHRGDRDTHAKWTALLRQYCALDTLAMAIIYKHWCSRVGIDF